MPLPALLTIQSGINQLRYATLKGIMAAKKKEIRAVAAAAGLTPLSEIVALACRSAEADAPDPGHGARGRERTGARAARRRARPGGRP